MSSMRLPVVAAAVLFAIACSRESQTTGTPVAQVPPVTADAGAGEGQQDLSVQDQPLQDHSGHDHAQPAAVASGAVTASGSASFEAPEARKDSVLLKKRATGNLADTIANPNQFRNPEVRDTYEKAKLVADRLDKMYCYCRCKENEHLAHNSLLTCFQDDHAALCGICLREAQQAFLDWNDDLPLEVTVKAVDLMYNQGRPAPSMP